MRCDYSLAPPFQAATEFFTQSPNRKLRHRANAARTTGTPRRMQFDNILSKLIGIPRIIPIIIPIIKVDPAILMDGSIFARRH
mmetsp:Transcript_16846/g.38628  ORF Transcript_16846/g.38628 Transcript_16846/m.38628 type:complete len:83 (-) Transcript_16846:1914-2162(-)